MFGVYVPRRHGVQPGLLNLMRFRDENGAFDVAGFEHAVRLWTIALEISVLMAQFPSKEIAERSWTIARWVWVSPISAAC